MMSGFSKTLLTTLYLETQLTWLMIDCSNSCTMSSQRLRNHADHQRGLKIRRLLRCKLYLTWRGACCTRSQSSSAWWFVHPSRSQYHCSRRNINQTEISLSQLKCLILVTRDRTKKSHTISVTDCLHVHHFAKSLKPFLGEVLCTQVCNIGNTWLSFQRDLFLGH